MLHEPIEDRSVIWPNGARCAVMLSFDFDAELVWADMDPSVNERLGVRSNGEYGATRGVQRCLDVLSAHSLTCSWMVPGLNIVNYPRQMKAIAERGHEIGNHGWAHENFGHRTLEQQRELLLRTNDAIEQLTGSQPAGFRAPAGELTGDTLRLLTTLGFRWSSSTRSDDRPLFIEVDEKPTDMVEIPGHWELDDFPFFMFNRSEPAFPAGQSRIASYDGVLDNWKAEFDAYYEAGLCYVIMFHPQAIGTPGRIQLLEELIEYIKAKEGVWFATGMEIADWWRAHGPTNPKGQSEAMYRRLVSERSRGESK
jgi:peptidoglycan/xylan/chitin deacetylase (PgdA/CDA1 family)